MSLGDYEIRAKLSEEDHRHLQAICIANGEEMAARLRTLVHEFVVAEIHKHTLLTRLLRSEGIVGEREGVPRG